MEFPINESTVVLVVAGIVTTILIGMLAHFAASSILSNKSNALDEDHYRRTK